MKKASWTVLLSVYLAVGVVGAEAEEKVDWGRLADCYAEFKKGRSELDPPSVGKGGIRVEMPMLETEKERMRALIEAKFNAPPPGSTRHEEKGSGGRPFNIFKGKVLQDRRTNPDSLHGDWNKGAPFAGRAKGDSPKG